MTQSQAHAALNSFVLRGWHEQRRCLLVITGKGSTGRGSGGQGMGVLRQVVPRWLNESPLRPWFSPFIAPSRGTAATARSMSC